MKASWTQIELTYLDETTTRTFKQNLGPYKLSQLRKTLTSQLGAGLDQSANQWLFYVNGTLIGPLDAANQRVQDFAKTPSVLRVTLEFRAHKQVGLRSRKRTREETETAQREEQQVVRKIIKQVPQADYNLTEKLVQLLREHRRVFESDRNGNGIVPQQLFFVLGHLQTHVGDRGDAYIQTSAFPQDGPLHALRVASQYRVSVGPYFTPGHVALLCVYNRGTRVIHLDSSSSITPVNYAFFQNASSFESFSYTLCNYQLYDATNIDVNLAGGNCGHFTGLHAVRSVLEAKRYADRRVSFGEFWQLFGRVLSLTPDAMQRRRVLRDTVVRLLYVCSSQAEQENCAHLEHFAATLPRQTILLALDHTDIVGAYFAVEHAVALARMDFVADIMMLDLLWDLRLGFHQVTLLGNALRTFLQDVTQRGFISAYARYQGSFACHGCGTLCVTQCSHCPMPLCGQACLQTHLDDNFYKV